MSAQDIVTKLKQFIAIIREEAKKLTDDELKHISNLEDYFPNCQIIIIKLGDLPEKHMIVTHDKNRPDLEIKVYEIETWEAVTELEKISNFSYWDREFSEEEKSHFWRVSNYKELIEGRLIFIIQSMENTLYIKPSERFWGSRSMLHERDFTAEFYNENAFDPEKEANKIIEQAKNQHLATQRKTISLQKELTKDEPITETPEKPKGYGTYIYYPIWLDEYPELSFREKIRGTRASYHLDKKKIIETYRGNTVIIEENGFIGICEKEKYLAKKYLNEIMGTGLLFGFPFFSVRDGDIAEFEAEPDKLRITSRQIIPRGNVMRRFDRTKPMWEPDILPYLDVSSDGLRKLLEISESINKEPELTNCLILLSEAYTCMQSSQFIQSFIVSWTIIERYLYWIWDSHLEKSGTSKKRRKKLSEGPNWNISSVIEMLEVNGLISNKEYKAISHLRRKRNKLIHEGVAVDQEDTTKCFNFSMIAMLSRTNAYKIHSEDALSRFIKKIHDHSTF